MMVYQDIRLCGPGGSLGGECLIFHPSFASFAVVCTHENIFTQKFVPKSSLKTNIYILPTEKIEPLTSKFESWSCQKRLLEIVIF